MKLKAPITPAILRSRATALTANGADLDRWDKAQRTKRATTIRETARKNLTEKGRIVR